MMRLALAANRHPGAARWAAVACWLCVLWAHPGGASEPAGKGWNLSETRRYLARQGPGSDVDRECGVDCLYLFLRTRGVECSVADVRRELVIGEYGTSLLNLRQVSESLGVEARIVRAAPENLEDLPLPAVAHLEPRQRSSR